MPSQRDANSFRKLRVLAAKLYIPSAILGAHLYPLHYRDYRAFSLAVTRPLGTKHVESRVTVNYGRQHP